MTFEKVDRSAWARREYFEHYVFAVPCTYSMTVTLDVTQIKVQRRKLYPTMLFYLTTVVNRHAEFRTAFNEAHELGVYSEMLPCYTVFHPGSETFSDLWTAYVPDIDEFCAAYERDIAQYGGQEGLVGKPNVPPNTFSVSMVPWAVFQGFHLNLQKGYDYLLPIFTMGKYYQKDGRYLMPLSIQVHHGVCDGFHISRFVNELQELISASGDTVVIRREEEKDYGAVEALVRRAFETAEHADGTEQDLVRALRKGTAYLPALSLVAEIDGRPVGHILFTKAEVGGVEVLALAPLSVLPEYQRQGVGTALIRAGHQIAGELGYGWSVVLGSETYYPRMGYRPADTFGIRAPFAVPRENFMACRLTEGAPAVRGTLRYAREFGIGDE